MADEDVLEGRFEGAERLADQLPDRVVVGVFHVLAEREPRDGDRDGLLVGSLVDHRDAGHGGVFDSVGVRVGAIPERVVGALAGVFDSLFLLVAVAEQSLDESHRFWYRSRMA